MKNLWLKFVHAVFGPPVKKDSDSRAVHWSRSYNSAIELMVNDAHAAEAPAREALEIAEKSFGIGNWRIFDSMENLLRIMLINRNANESEELCDRLLEMTKHYYGEDSAKTVELLTRLPRLFLDWGNQEKADKLFREAIPALRKYYGPDNHVVVSMLHDFASLCNTLGRRKAEQWTLRKLIKYARRKKFIKREREMEILLAASFAEGGDFAMAEELSRTLPDQVRLPCNEQDYEMAMKIPRLADLCLRSGRYEQAEDLFELNIRVVKFCNKNKDYPGLIPGLSGLARVCFETERLSKTESLLWRAHRIIVKAYLSRASGDNHFPDDALLQFLDGQGRHDESEALLLEVAEKCEERFGRNSVKMYVILYDLGCLYLKHGKLDEADSCYSEALETAKGYCGPESPDIIYMLAGRGDTLLEKGRYREAIKRLLEALELYEKTDGGDTPFLANLFFSLGKAELEIGNYKNAELYFCRQIAMIEEQSEPTYQMLAPALAGLGMTMQKMKRYSEAEAIFNRVIKLYDAAEKDVVEGSLLLAIALKLLADIHVCREEIKEAENVYYRALEILDTPEGRDSPWLGGCLEGIARVLFESGRHAEIEPYFSRAIQIYEKTGAVPEDYLKTMKEYLANLRMNPLGSKPWLHEEPDKDKDNSIN